MDEQIGCDRVRLEVNPFRMGTDKEAALKPLEEAAEVFGAWQELERWSKCVMYSGITVSDVLVFSTFACEIADCITACVNLADRYGIDLQSALDAVEKHNMERGRYDVD